LLHWQSISQGIIEWIQRQDFDFRELHMLLHFIDFVVFIGVVLPAVPLVSKIVPENLFDRFERRTVGPRFSKFGVIGGVSATSGQQC
jgi:hypothetical protein